MWLMSNQPAKKWRHPDWRIRWAQRRALGRHKHRWTTKSGEQYAGIEVCPECGATRENPAYLEGRADGEAGRDPNPERLAYGANSCNAYERGYIDSGRPVPADPNSED